MAKKQKTKKQSKNYVPEVRSQYEALPYPPRNPEDEKHRLRTTLGDNLNSISHYGYNGRADFANGFRALVAGGGTGDAVISLAEQLKEFKQVEIVYLDLSKASKKIAKERAKVRKLTNIEWITDSVLNVPELNLGRFDYINCSGMLHHLADPQAGLQALTSVLKDDGLLFLMLYGEYGRRAVYMMQDLFRRLFKSNHSIEEKTKLARKLLDSLPGNSFYEDIKRNWANEISLDGNGDAGLYDLLLHSTDRCYSVTDIYELLGQEGLNVISYIGQFNRYYDLENLISPYKYSALFDDQAPGKHSHASYSQLHQDSAYQKRVALAEKIFSKFYKQTFYASKNRNTIASIDDEDLAVYLASAMEGKAQQLSDTIIEGKPLTMQYQMDGHHEKVDYHFGAIHKEIVKHFDGTKPIKAIINQVKFDTGEEDEQLIKRSLAELFNLFHEANHCFLCEPNKFYRKKQS